MTKYIILLSAVMAFACNSECEQRKIAALERIATALEKLNNNNSYHPNVVVNSYKTPEPTIKKTYETKINGRSLKAVPTVDTECIDECMMELLPSRRDDCIETKCGGGND